MPKIHIRPFSKLSKFTNWQITTDALILIIEAQRQNLLWGFLRHHSLQLRYLLQSANCQFVIFVHLEKGLMHFENKTSDLI